jgi:hypothetical protein
VKSSIVAKNIINSVGDICSPFLFQIDSVKKADDNTVLAYKNALDKIGVKYKTITDDVVLSPSRKDVLYTIIGNTTVKEDQTEFPDYTIIEVYVCEICC